MESIILRYNKVAMDYLQYENYKDTFTLLKKAESILNNNDNEYMPKRLKLFSITFNNLGCYYKKTKKPLVALSYLQKALELETEIKSDISAIASSHLNICAILSNLRKHEEALIHSEKATKLLESARLNSPDNPRILSNLVISYYNSAVELEFLGKFQACFDNYTLAYKVCREIGNSHPLLYSIEKTMQKLRSKNPGIAKKVQNEERSMKKHIRFPSVTPTLPKVNHSRVVMTPIKVYTGRNSPYDDLKHMSLKRSM